MGLKEAGLRGSLRSVSTGVSAIPDSVVFQPESDDLQHFAGDTGRYNITTESPVYDGSHSLKNDGTSTDPQFIGSLSGLPNYPSVGRTHSVFVNPNDSSGSDDPAPFIFWGHSSETAADDGYALVYVGGVDDELQLKRYESGSNTNLDTDSTPDYPSDGWLAYDILHEADGTLTVECYDATNETSSTYRDGPLLTTLSATDSTHLTSGSYDSQGVGFQSVRNTKEVFDLWRTE